MRDVEQRGCYLTGVPLSVHLGGESHAPHLPCVRGSNISNIRHIYLTGEFLINDNFYDIMMTTTACGESVVAEVKICNCTLLLYLSDILWYTLPDYNQKSILLLLLNYVSMKKKILIPFSF